MKVRIVLAKELNAKRGLRARDYFPPALPKHRWAQLGGTVWLLCVVCGTVRYNDKFDRVNNRYYPKGRGRVQLNGRLGGGLKREPECVKRRR